MQGMSDGEVGPGRGSGRPSGLLRPVQIRVTDRELDALRARLVNAARLPELPGRPGEYGGSAASVQALWITGETATTGRPGKPG